MGSVRRIHSRRSLRPRTCFWIQRKIESLFLGKRPQTIKTKYNNYPLSRNVELFSTKRIRHEHVIDWYFARYRSRSDMLIIARTVYNKRTGNDQLFAIRKFENRGQVKFYKGSLADEGRLSNKTLSLPFHISGSFWTRALIVNTEHPNRIYTYICVRTYVRMCV